MEDRAQFAAIFNLCEASLWFVIAAIIAWKLCKRTQIARFYWLLPPTFVVFGISDFIESRTGAFWEPQWLLVMKTGCVVVFVDRRHSPPAREITPLSGSPLERKNLHIDSA